MYLRHSVGIVDGMSGLGCAADRRKTAAWGLIVPPAAIMVFIILNGGLKLESAGAVGTFTAVCAAFFTSFTYCWLRRKMPAEHFFAPGADYNFNQAFTAILPMLAVLLSAAVFNEGIRLIFHTESFQDVFVLLSNTLFRHMGRDLSVQPCLCFCHRCCGCLASMEPTFLKTYRGLCFRKACRSTSRPWRRDRRRPRSLPRLSR